MKLSTLTLLLLVVHKGYARNPFSNFVSRFKGEGRSRSRGNLKESALGSIDDTGDIDKGNGEESDPAVPEELNDLFKLRSNVRINSRDDVLSAAINAVSSVSSAFIYFYLMLLFRFF